jgi:hypothetical protein
VLVEGSDEIRVDALIVEDGLSDESTAELEIMNVIRIY